MDRKLPLKVADAVHQNECHDLVFAFVAAVGVNLPIAEAAFNASLKRFGYEVNEIKITRDVITRICDASEREGESAFSRIGRMMDLGTAARKKHGWRILAEGVAAGIQQLKVTPLAEGKRARAFIIHSLKHPDEVACLRTIYQRNFYLIGIHTAPEMRKQNLSEIRGMSRDEAENLMRRDRREDSDEGQHVNETFHLADFFIGWPGDENLKNTSPYLPGFPQEKMAQLKGVNVQRISNSIDRFLDVIHGHPNHTPTFGEHAMYLAFTAALRSADLSRQVGAVLARSGEILSTGANDCPAAGGGLYWSHFDTATGAIIDVESGRDYKRGFDSNVAEQTKVVRRILRDACRSGFLKEDIQKLRTILNKSPIRSLTEYGRVVHAEMEALMSCARQGISTKEATLYSTTFPCHNCAKHIIAAGVDRVVFIEPYLKSKAFEFHKEAMAISYPQNRKPGKRRPSQPVQFEPFFGIGPRRFFDLFSMHHGVGTKMDRKEKNGKALGWAPLVALLRLSSSSAIVEAFEKQAAERFENIVNMNENTCCTMSG
ncbi:anti-phage dCTP deaminase [soil metagenome]